MIDSPSDPHSPRRARQVAGVVMLLLASTGWIIGCGPGGSGNASPAGAGEGAGAYGTPAPRTDVAEAVPARAITEAALDPTDTLTVLQSELSPATLWRSAADRVRVFANLEASGLGGPSFLAYSSPTGIAALRPGDRLEGVDLRESWLLAGFAGAAGWTNFDSPWAVFLERRPRRVTLGTHGVEILFAGPAGHFSLMPLYGYEKPPQKGREFDGGSGPDAPALRGAKGRDPKLLTWEWPLAVARDPLTRLRYWAGATRRFPVACEDMVSVDRAADVVTVRQSFRWLEVPDAWGTRPIRVAPVSPALGLVLLPGERFPVEFDRAPFDFGIATPYGPFFGIPDVDAYEARFPVLQYVNATEQAIPELPDGAPAVARVALERLRAVARESVAAAGVNGWDLPSAWVHATALPWLDPVTRSNAVASLGRYLREEVLVPARFVEREVPSGSGRRWWVPEGLAPRLGGEPADPDGLSSSLLQLVWAYAHHAGDHVLVRDRWPILRRLFVTGARTRWAGFGPDGRTQQGEGAAAAMAYARLAYLAGDLDAYQHGCGVLAREWVHLHVKQRGTRWFRERQPWHSPEPIGADAYPTHLLGSLAGWQLEGARGSHGSEGRRSGNRWGHLHDSDVARYSREHWRADVRLELGRLAESTESGQGGADDASVLRSRVRLESLLFRTSPTNLAAIVAPDRLEGPPGEVLAVCLAFLRTAQPARLERLIPRVPATGFVTGVARDVPGPHPHLVQAVVWDTRAPSWPRVTWGNWKTPNGQRWNFGEVQAGSGPAPAAVREEPVSWNTVRHRSLPSR